MIIGIDIDDTIAKTNVSLLEEAYEYDKEHCGGRGYKNKDAYSLRDMFYWTDEEVLNFMSYIRDSNLFTDISPIKDSVLFVNKLYDQGYKIVFITRRKNTAHMLKITMKWLDKHGFKYNKLIMGISEKGQICEKEKIDLFIDNDVEHVRDVLSRGIDALLITDNYNKGVDDLKRVSGWKEIYNYINM